MSIKIKLPDIKTNKYKQSKDVYAYLVYYYIQKKCENSPIHISLDEIAEEVKISKWYVSKLITYLKSKGLIEYTNYMKNREFTILKEIKNIEEFEKLQEVKSEETK